MKMKSWIALILCLCLAAIVLTGCGDDKDKDKKSSDTATVAATQAATTAPATKATQPAQNNNQNNNQNQNNDATQAPATDGSMDEDGYISQSEAVAAVRGIEGNGITILNVYQGYAPDGKQAWIIIIQPITTGDGPDTVTYYVNDGFCYTTDYDSTPDDDDNLYAGVSEDYAIDTAISAMGEPYAYQEAFRGYTDGGEEAWVVVLRLEAGAGDTYAYYYVSSNFAYPVIY